MNAKKIIKITLIIILSLAIILAAAAIAVFEFVIKPNTKVITEAVEQIITDEEFIKEFEIEDLDMEELSEIIDEEIPDTPDTPQTTNKPKKDQSEYKSTYNYVKDNVDSKDFKKGVTYASRIDIAYVLGLLKGGLTVPEKRELKAYLKERFTNAEINEGVSLYNKYSYLLK